jgi:hypothetical protein
MIRARASRIDDISMTIIFLIFLHQYAQFCGKDDKDKDMEVHSFN